MLAIVQYFRRLAFFIMRRSVLGTDIIFLGFDYICTITIPNSNWSPSTVENRKNHYH